MLETDLLVLKRLGPFSALGDADLETIAQKGRFRTLARGDLLFKRSSHDPDSHWLLTGRLNLVNDAFENRSFTESDSQNYGPVDDFNPHKVSAVCEQECLLFSLPKSAQETIETFLESAAKTAEVAPDDGQWMERLLRTPLFEFIPPTHIQALFKRFESTSAAKGDVIVKQGDPGDYFYVIKSGTVAVEIKSDAGMQQVAILSAGQCFGQDALISDLPRNATVTATHACQFARISEADFEDLLLAPVIGVVKREEFDALSKAEEAPVKLIDIRVDGESTSTEDSTISIPFLELRNHLTDLSRSNVYVVQGPSAKKISLLGAYLLNEHGFTAYVLAPDT